MTSTNERERADALAACAAIWGHLKQLGRLPHVIEDALTPVFLRKKGCAMPTPREPGASRLQNDPIHGLKLSWRRKRAAKKSKRRPFQPDCSGLEPRTLLATFLVTTTADSGSSPLSLRQAIIDSNATPGLNTIDFSIGAVGSQQTIAPAVGAARDHQPGVDRRLEPGRGRATPALPLIVIDGTSAGTGSDGLDLDRRLRRQHDPRRS